jgi:hypothetical protein
VKEECQVTINRFSALENLEDNGTLIRHGMLSERI